MDFLLASPAGKWIQEEPSLRLGSAVVALALCGLVFYQRLGFADNGREPPWIPYKIPFLGHALSFTRDFDNFMEWIRNTMPPDMPYRLYMGGQTIYFVNSPRIYAKIIRYSKNMSFDLLEKHLFDKVFQMSKKDMDIFSIGMHGVPPPPHLSKEEVEEQEMTTKFLAQYKENWFTGTAGLEVLSNKFTEIWGKELNDISGGDVAGVFSLKHLTEYSFWWAAAAVSLGTHLKDVAPDMAHHFWIFEAGFLRLFQEQPAFLLRDTIKAKDELLAGIARYAAEARKNSPNPGHDVLWEEWWGGRIQWQRDGLLASRGISEHARACHHLGLLWALNANTSPSIAWMIIHILRNPYLVPKLRAELDTAVTYGPTGEPVINWEILTKLPLWTSTYQETLRLTISSMTARVITDDLELEGYLVKKGRMVIAPARALHMSPVWNKEGHPRQDFWAERFMIPEGEKLKLMNSWRPFAGGTTYCPGRYVAGAEILAAVAMLLLKFDLVLEENEGPLGLCKDKHGIGAVPPDRDAKLHFKLRNL